MRKSLGFSAQSDSPATAARFSVLIACFHWPLQEGPARMCGCSHGSEQAGPSLQLPRLRSLPDTDQQLGARLPKKTDGSPSGASKGHRVAHCSARSNINLGTRFPARGITASAALQISKNSQRTHTADLTAVRFGRAPGEKAGVGCYAPCAPSHANRRVSAHSGNAPFRHASPHAPSPRLVFAVPPSSLPFHVTTLVCQRGAGIKV